MWLKVTTSLFWVFCCANPVICLTGLACDTILTGNTGTITSQNYPLYSDCTIYVYIPAASSICVKFNKFARSENDDFLYYGVGTNNDLAKAIGRLSGSGWPLPGPIYFRQGAVWFRFTSTDSGSYLGWSLTYTSSSSGTPNTWSSWEAWGDCSRTCGGGTRTRERSCLGCSCFGSEKSSSSCNTEVCLANVRLSDGPSPSEGRLEVRYDGQWGTVCGDVFTTVNAGVVCRELGYKDALAVNYSALFLYGKAVSGSTIWLLDDNCAGYEPSIVECGHLPWGKNNCNHTEDVGLKCSGELVSGSLQSGIGVSMAIIFGILIAAILG